MKKILLLFTIIFTVLSSVAFSANQYSENWGVVVKVTPITETNTFKKPRYKTICSENNYSSQRTANMIIGGLVGSVIGNEISNKHGAGTIGALFGTLVGAEQSNYPITSHCHQETYYITETERFISHYKIKVRTKNGYKIIRSQERYNVHDIITLY